jgi:hypothetical protein
VYGQQFPSQPQPAYGQPQPVVGVNASKSLNSVGRITKIHDLDISLLFSSFQTMVNTISLSLSV